MRLTDVENFARRLPTRATLLTNPQTTAPRGTFNAAHLTDAPPYEHRRLAKLRSVADAMTSSEAAAETKAKAREMVRRARDAA